MRTVLVIGVIVVVLLLVGWLRFGTSDGNPTIQVDTDKVKQDTSAVVESAKDAIEEVDRRVDVDVDVDTSPDVDTDNKVERVESP